MLSPLRLLDVCLVSRIAGYLSDHLGDPISLRQAAAAISPSGRLLSPHTSEAYLEALADAYLVEKVIRFDISEDAPQSTRYCYFFTSLELRNAQFGTAPDHEAKRIKANKAWLQLRRDYNTVYIASGSPKVDFVTCGKGGEKAYWKMSEAGLVRVSPDAIVAG